MHCSDTDIAAEISGKNSFSACAFPLQTSKIVVQKNIAENKAKWQSLANVAVSPKTCSHKHAQWGNAYKKNYTSLIQAIFQRSKPQINISSNPPAHGGGQFEDVLFHYCSPNSICYMRLFTIQ